MLDDEIQRLIELFNRTGDKTGFVRLLEPSDIKQLLLNLVTNKLESNSCVKIVHSAVLNAQVYQGNSGFGNNRQWNTEAVDSYLGTQNLVRVAKVSMDLIPDLQTWLVKEHTSGYVPWDRRLNCLVMDSYGEIIMLTVVKSEDLIKAKIKADDLRKQLSELEALGA